MFAGRYRKSISATWRNALCGNIGQDTALRREITPIISRTRKLSRKILEIKNTWVSPLVSSKKHKENDMENIVVNTKVYVNTLIDKLIAIKDSNRGTLTRNEVDTINAACNLLEHNIERIEKV